MTVIHCLILTCMPMLYVCVFLRCVRTCIRYTCMHVPYMCTQRGYVFLTGVCSACMCYLHMHAACVCTFGDAVQCRNFYQFLLGWWGNFFLLSVLRFSFFIFILPKVTCLAGRTQVSRFLNHRVLSRYPVLVRDEQNTCGQICGVFRKQYSSMYIAGVDLFT